MSGVLSPRVTTSFMAVQQEHSISTVCLPEEYGDTNGTKDITTHQEQPDITTHQEQPQTRLCLPGIIVEDITPRFSVSPGNKDEERTYPGLRRNKQHIYIDVMLIAATTILVVVILGIARPADNMPAPLSPLSSSQPATPLDDSTQVPDENNIFNRPTDYFRHSHPRPLRPP